MKFHLKLNPCYIGFDNTSKFQLDLNFDRRLSILHNSNLSRFILISLTFCQNANSLFLRIFEIHHNKNNIIQLRLTLLSLSLYTRFLIFKRAVFIYGLKHKAEYMTVILARKVFNSNNNSSILFLKQKCSRFFTLKPLVVNNKLLNRKLCISWAYKSTIVELTTEQMKLRLQSLQLLFGLSTVPLTAVCS